MKDNRSMFLYAIILSSAFAACGQVPADQNYSSEVPNHSAWDELLDKHVDIAGGVNYRGMIKDSTVLIDYLQELAINTPNDNWPKSDQLAYWINLYNAATVKLITKHYPIASIKDIGSSIQIPFINTPWQVEFIRLNGELIDLDKIEHGIIRKEFDEPRIHFALVCAAKSCPTLRNEAYQAVNLDEQLTDQARIFLSDKTKNDLSTDHLVISKLFKWYGGDFKKHTTLIAYLNHYSPTPIDQHADIDYMDYNWGLNEQE
jgi:hypothetical protein